MKKWFIGLTAASVLQCMPVAFASALPIFTEIETNLGAPHIPVKINYTNSTEIRTTLLRGGAPGPSPCTPNSNPGFNYNMGSFPITVLTGNNIYFGNAGGALYSYLCGPFGAQGLYIASATTNAGACTPTGCVFASACSNDVPTGYTSTLTLTCL